MIIEAIDFFYLAGDTIADIGDGSQDSLVVRLRAGDHVGWGECDTSPLVAIASLVTPMSHSACHGVQDSVLGERVEGPEDIIRINNRARARSYDQLQAAHTISGIDTALWDLLGRSREVPVHQLLGVDRPLPKRPYASVLFGETPEETLRAGQRAAAAGFTAVKFGWQGFGHGTVAQDADQLMAAREGIGPDADLLVDAAMAFEDDVDRAAARIPALEAARVYFLEEAFWPGAVRAYRALRPHLRTVKLAAGEESHHRHIAEALVRDGGVDFIQIDAGRIGGITESLRVHEIGAAHGCTYINHTFTSDLALSSSLQPILGDVTAELCEYPTDPCPVARDLTQERILPDANGQIVIPDAPGLGVEIDAATLERYRVDVAITVAGRTLYSTPEV